MNPIKNSIKYFFIVLMVISSSLISQEPELTMCEEIGLENKKRDFFIEYRMAAFVPRAKRFRDVYCEAGCSYQLEGMTSIYKCYYGWANVDWFTKHGHSSLYKSTQISIANVSFGIKSLYRFDDHFTGYVGIGACFADVSIRNKFIQGHEHVNRIACGGVFKSGVYYSITSRFYIDTFFDYFYQPVHYHASIDVGGVKLGSSIGVRF